MPRRAKIVKRVLAPDPRYGSETVSRFMNKIMERGKKGLAERIVYGAFEIVGQKTGADPLEVFETALRNATPVLEVKPRRVGGATYQVPVQIEGPRRQVNLRSIVEGIEFIWIQRIILSLFLLDFAVVLVGFYRPILPIFAADVFKTGAAGLGLLYAAPSAGSLLGTTVLLMAGDVQRKGVLVIVAALFFAAGLALLGSSQWFWMAVVAVLLLGFADSISVAIRRTVVQLLAPDGMLGRAASLITVFAQTTNGLGALLAGITAQYMGASNALLVGSALCFVMILGICLAIPQLWRYRS